MRQARLPAAVGGAGRETSKENGTTTKRKDDDMEMKAHPSPRRRTGGRPHPLPALALALACGLAASCGTEEPSGDALPGGPRPLRLTAELPQAQTRSAGKDAWAGGEEIGVRLGGATGKYVVGATGAATPAAAADALYWRSAADAQVAAWYPYAAGGAVDYDISDQSGGYEGYDILRATATGRYDAPVALRFSHQLAKVEVTLAAGAGVTAAEVAGASVTFFGAPAASVAEGEVGAAARSDGAIRPCHDAASPRYEAVVVPQDMTGKPLVRVSLGGKDFVYTPATGTAGNLEGGRRYVYTVTVKADGIEVTAAAGGTWSAGGGEDVAVVAYKAYTEAERGDYLLADGRLLPKGTALTAAQKASVSAVVFWTPAETDPTDPNRKTPASLADDRVMSAEHPSCTHGLAVAVKNVSDGMAWQNPWESVKAFQSGDNFTPPGKAGKDLYVSVASNFGSTDSINFVLGYQNTQVLLAYNAWCKATSGKENCIVRPAAALAAFSASHPAPAGSTGWFVPSVKELHMLCHADADDVWEQRGTGMTGTKALVNVSLSSAGGDALGGWYWSSTEYEDGSDGAFDVGFGDAYVSSGFKDVAGRVRAVCAF